MSKTNSNPVYIWNAFRNLNALKADKTPDSTQVPQPPNVTPEVAPDVTPDVTPDVAPDVTPDVAPDVELGYVKPSCTNDMDNKTGLCLNNCICWRCAECISTDTQSISFGGETGSSGYTVPAKSRSSTCPTYYDSVLVNTFYWSFDKPYQSGETGDSFITYDHTNKTITYNLGLPGAKPQGTQDKLYTIYMAGAINQTINMKWKHNPQNVDVNVIVYAFPNPPWSGTTTTTTTGKDGGKNTIKQYVPTCIPNNNNNYVHMFRASGGDASYKFSATDSALTYIAKITEAAVELAL